MANRAERRAAEKGAKAAATTPRRTRDIPPEVQQRIAAAQGRKPAAPPAGVEGPPPGANGAAEGPLGDAPPLGPEGLPDQLKDAIAAAQGLTGADGGPTGGAAGGAAGLLAAAGKQQRRGKRFVALERELAVILTMPAPVFGASGDHYCEMHFVMQGPALAAALVHYAESHAGFFALLQRAVEAGGIFTLAIAVASYALPPMMHHGLPAPGPLRSIFGVPDGREPTPAEREQAAAESERMMAEQRAATTAPA